MARYRQEGKADDSDCNSVANRQTKLLQNSEWISHTCAICT